MTDAITPPMIRRSQFIRGMGSLLFGVAFLVNEKRGEITNCYLIALMFAGFANNESASGLLNSMDS